MQILPITHTYTTAGRGRGGGTGPPVLLQRGVLTRLRELGHRVAEPEEVIFSGEAQALGGWDLVAGAGGALRDTVVKMRRSEPEGLILGLLADCNALLGMLGGLQTPVDGSWPRRVGLAFLDAHADYNTPDSSPSGMLGGMPVAVAAGKSLASHRLRADLRYPLQAPDIVMAGLRDTDEGEARAIRSDGIFTLTSEDLEDPDEAASRIMDPLVARQDCIYIHVDLDILDPRAAPAAGLPTPGGISGEHLGRLLRAMLAYPRVAALSVVSYRGEDDEDGRTAREVEGALLGALRCHGGEKG
ncbi:MAG: arginase family protein [Bacillota bacterium]